MTEPLPSPILFFDGHCALCDNTVQWLLWCDRRHRLKFAPLQGETARERLPAEFVQDLRTLVLLDSGGLWRYSSAAVRILWHVGGLCRFLSVLLWCIPRPIRNWCYRVIASNRYSWFGRRETCRLPQPGERQSFLP